MSIARTNLVEDYAKALYMKALTVGRSSLSVCHTNFFWRKMTSTRKSPTGGGRNFASQHLRPLWERLFDHFSHYPYIRRLPDLLLGFYQVSPLSTSAFISLDGKTYPKPTRRKTDTILQHRIKTCKVLKKSARSSIQDIRGPPLSRKFDIESIFDTK